MALKRIIRIFLQYFKKASLLRSCVIIKTQCPQQDAASQDELSPLLQSFNRK